MKKYVILYTCYDNDTTYSDCSPTTYDTLEKAKEELSKQMYHELYYFNDLADQYEDMADIRYHIEKNTVWVTSNGETKPITKYDIGLIVL